MLRFIGPGWRFARVLLAASATAHVAHALTDAVVQPPCDEAAFDTALATVQTGGGGTLIFTAAKQITTAVTLDGANQITLSGGNATRLFVVNAGASLTIRKLTLTNGLVPSGYSAGAVANLGTLHVEDSIIKNSNATSDGGAIYNSGLLTISNSQLIGNATSNGSGGAIVSYGPLTITNSLLANNSATFGGALYSRWSAATTTIINSQLRENHATGTDTYGGGAMLLWDGATVTIQGGTIINNTAKIAGGDIDNPFANSSMVLTDVTLSGNSADVKGGGIENDGTATLTNLTLSGNAADSGGGIYNNDKATLTNVTLSGNTANNAATHNCGVSPPSPSMFSSGFNLSDDNSCTPFFTKAGDRNNTDAKLGPLADNGGGTLTHLPQPGSPLIDGGQCKPDVPIDQRGVARPQGAACDIGAVEVGEAPPAPSPTPEPEPNPSPTPRIYLPLLTR